ncbi:hypothetical protein [Congregibacter sp.]
MPKKLLLLTFSALIWLTACATGGGYNPTVFPFEVETERLAESPVRTVVIPHVNLGSPSRNHLEDVAPRIDARISSYLKANGYKVLPQRDFKQHWNAAVRAFGDPVDPTTGRVNMKTFSQIMQSVRDRFIEVGELEAFVFTDLVELDVPFNGGLKHIGRWDGVSRRPSMQGPGTGVSADFDWSMTAAVASVQITIFDTDLQRLFVSRGGLDATDAIDARSSTGRYVRRRSLLENNQYLDEGIALALHPLIEMEKYPGNP